MFPHLFLSIKPTSFPNCLSLCLCLWLLALCRCHLSLDVFSLCLSFALSLFFLILILSPGVISSWVSWCASIMHAAFYMPTLSPAHESIFERMKFVSFGLRLAFKIIFHLSAWLDMLCVFPVAGFREPQEQVTRHDVGLPRKTCPAPLFIGTNSLGRR